MNNELNKTRKLTILGVMLALTIILDITPLGAIPLFGVSATITHLPTIVTGILLGPLYGLAMGTSFGLISLFHALTRPVSPLDPLFINPLISVLPRMLIGVVSYYAYAGVRRLLGKETVGQTISAVIGGVAGSLTNTVLVLGMLYVVYLNEIISRLGLADVKAVNGLYITIVSTNALMEAIVAGVVAPAILVAYMKVFQRK